MTSKLEKIEPPNSFLLSAAIGWVELGNPAEAAMELSQVDPALAMHPDVLEVRWVILASSNAWDEGLMVAEHLRELAPERPSSWLHRSYAMRRASTGSLGKAWETLLPAAELFPECPTIPYNLACYACQLDRFEDARRWLEKARLIGGKKYVQSMALKDSDLERLWPEIQRWQ